MVRKPRVDSVRNRGLILEAARQEIADRGPEVGMDEIASRAEVAVGTLYRHFPTKEALVTAIVGESMEQVADDAEHRLALCEAGEPARVQLVAFIEALIALSAENQAVLAAMEAIGASKGTDSAEARATTAITRLIEHFQSAGAFEGPAPLGTVSASPLRHLQYGWIVPNLQNGLVCRLLSVPSLYPFCSNVRLLAPHGGTPPGGTWIGKF